MTIDEACHESTKDGRPYKKFHFFCTDTRCRENKVQILAAVYDRLPSERKVTPHYKRDPRSPKHEVDCEWNVLYRYYSFEGVHPDETADEARLRRLRFKLHDILEVYDPTVQELKLSPTVSNNADIRPTVANQTTRQTKTSIDNTRLTRNSTTVFSRLAQHHHELQQLFPDIDDFKKIKLHVVGLGDTTRYQYFSVLKFAKDKSKDHVIFGWINRNIKRYNKGFKIYFASKIDDQNVSLYIPSEMIESYRFRRTILDFLDNSNKMKTISAYFVCEAIELTTLPSGKIEYQVKIQDLSKFAFVSDL